MNAQNVKIDITFQVTHGKSKHTTSTGIHMENNDQQSNNMYKAKKHIISMHLFPLAPHSSRVESHI